MPPVDFIHSSNKTNTTESNRIMSHAQNTTEVQPNVFLTWTHRLLGTDKERLAFPSTNIFQGQLVTPQSVSVLRPAWQ